jgi:periplasmic protein TonB
LVNNIHSFRLSETGAGRGARGPVPARGVGDYALFANDAFSAIAGPANHAVPAGAAGVVPPGYDLLADVQANPANAYRRGFPYRAIAAGLALHLLVFVLFIARFGPSQRLGVEEGRPDTLNVSVVSAADLERFHSDPFRQDARLEQQQALPSPPQPEPREAKEAVSAPQPKASDRRDTSFDPSRFIATASEQFSSQLKQAFKAAESHHETQKRPISAAPNLKALRPGATHVGKSDQFERDVIWALGATVPMGNGKWGSTVVTFIVSESGKVDGLRLLKTSGDNWLDTGALMAVRQARMPVPPPGLPVGDRSFNIEYLSLPER